MKQGTVKSKGLIKPVMRKPVPKGGAHDAGRSKPVIVRTKGDVFMDEYLDELDEEFEDERDEE